MVPSSPLSAFAAIRAGIEAAPAESSSCARASAPSSSSRSRSSSTSARVKTSIRGDVTPPGLQPGCAATWMQGSYEQRQGPVASMLGVQREEHDPLPLAEAERAFAERNLLGA